MKVYIYWCGIIGIAGKGPNWVEEYNPNKTFGEISRSMLKIHGKIRFLKVENGKYNGYYPNETKLGEVFDKIKSGNDIWLVFAEVK